MERFGIKEVVLCGVNIGKYDYKGDGLSALLALLLKKTNLPRIRISSINPEDITEGLIRVFENKRLCSHFHLSLQSGSDTVLKRMNRRYTTADYENTVNKIRANIKDVQITTDVIVGFPGETAEDFQKTCQFVEKMRFLKVHVFRYSKRAGTVAANMKDQSAESIKSERAILLKEVEKKSRESILSGMVGQEIEVLFESKKRGFYEGMTTSYLKIKKPEKDQNLRNKILKEKVISSDKKYLYVN